MTINSLILGAAAGLITTGAAQAADLPMSKDAAVEYVKVCTEFGAGFFYIPGSDTCLRIGGEIRADYGYQQPEENFATLVGERFSVGTEFRSRGQITFDARTTTEYGLLRSFVAINAEVTDNVAGVAVEKAFVQFGGLTAGYAHSFWGFYDNEYGNTIWGSYFTHRSSKNLLAYSAAFSDGFTATLSIEDGRDTSRPLFFPAAGQRMPDILGQFRIDQSWGKAAIQAVLHSADSGPIGTDAFNTNQNKPGYAFGGALALNLPIAAGGHIVVEGQYAKGATAYLGAPAVLFSILRDGEISSGAFRLSSGWSVVAEFGVDMTPNLTANLVGSYARVNDIFERGHETSVWSVSGNVWYTITVGLSVGGEISYLNRKFDVPDVLRGPNVNIKTDAWMGVVRIKRTF